MPGLGGGGSQTDEQVRFPGAAVTDQAKWLAGFDPGAGRQLMDDRGVDQGVGGEVELFDALVAWEAGVVDAPCGATLVPVVAFGHDEFGEKAEVGKLLAFGRGGDLFEPVTDGGQP